MAMMMGNLYQALVEGGTSADAAKKATKEVADHQKQLADIHMDLGIVKALLGVTVTGVLALVIKTFFI